MLVKNIKFINNKVEVVLDTTSFFISKENYIENPLAIDSSIEQDRIDYLKEYENVIEGKQYLIKLLNKRALSEYEVYLKLKERDIDVKYIKSVIDSLKRSGLINDEFVALITVDSEMIKKRGKKSIVRSLKDKRIKEDIINKVIEGINDDLYMDNFNKLIDKYSKMYEKKSQKMKESLLKKKMEELGYENELVCSVNVESDISKEVELAKSSIIKIVRSKNIDLNSYENINKIKTKLVMKGFSYDIINLALEEVKQDETY